MVALITLVVIATVSLLAVRTGATALMMTGLSWDAASFQSYSAFFGVGFTTREAELVVNHPIRRRIIRDLILVGNIGLTSAVATMVATMIQHSGGLQPLYTVGGLALGVALLVYLSRVIWIQRILDRLIQKTLNQAGLVRALDYELLLRIQLGYVVSEIDILSTTPLVNQSLATSRPWDHGVVVLAVKREGAPHPGIPGADTVLREGDVITVYGEEKNIHKLFDLATLTDEIAAR
jgi:hypothetical protein